MYSFLETLDKISAKILDPLKRFPIASLVMFMFVLLVGINSQVHHMQEYNNMLGKITFLCFFGFFFLLALRLIGKNTILPLLGLLILIGIYFYMPESVDEFINHQQGKTVFPMILMGLLSLLIVAPFITYKGSNREFFEWLKQLLYAIALSAIVGILFFIVLNVAREIIVDLFDIDKKGYYSEIIGLSSLFLSTLFFLFQLPKEPRELEKKEYNNIEKIFFKYILSSLFIAYFLIIYIYTGKMIILAEYPNGVVSINIIAFSALAILTYIFWTPLWSEKNQNYKRVIWIAILLQTVLLATALYLRVESYGWTMGRVALVSAWLWLFVISVYFIVKKDISYRAIFLSIPVVIIFNLLFGSSISKGSQQDRLTELLANSQSLSEESNISLRYNISSKIEYLYRHHGTDALLPIIPLIVNEFENQKSEIVDNCTVPNNKNFLSYATDKLGFKYIDKWNWKRHLREKSYKNKEKITKRYTASNYDKYNNLDIAKYDWLMRFHHQRKSGFSASPICNPQSTVEESKFTINSKEKKILIKEKEEIVAELDLEKFINKILKKGKENGDLDSYYIDDFTQKDFTYFYENNKVIVKLIFESFDFSFNDELVSYNGIVLIGDKRED